MTIKIATWNINSIRARQDRLLAWLSRAGVDVLAVQETKIPDDKFPDGPINDLGFEVVHHGFSQWNGVALISRIGLDQPQIGFRELPTFGDPAIAEARAISAICGGVRVFSLYVPNGRTVDDPHFAYKLAWLAALRRHVAEEIAADPHAQIILAGDFNIAPTDDDVWDMTAFENSTHVTPAERQAFGAFIEDGFVDVVRPYAPGPGTFTYWDYQQLRFAKKQGMRIDFTLASPALAPRTVGAMIDRQERKGKGASDHAPVIIELADSP